MNTPNPLIPQGSLERKAKATSTVRIAILTIVSIHAVFFAGLLMQGCRRDDGKTAANSAEAATNQNTLPPIDAGYYSGTQEVAQTPTPSSGPSPAATITPAAVTEAVTTLPPAGSLEPAAEGKPYKIVKGDTLLKIARANGITVGALSKANPNVDPSKLHPGQTIQLPAPAAPAASSGLGFKEPGATGKAASTAGVHTVKPGDTLVRLARQYGTTVKAIRAANALKTDRLVVGKKLKIPPARATHTTKESGKSTASPKLTATNPAQAKPGPDGANATDLR